MLFCASPKVWVQQIRSPVVSALASAPATWSHCCVVLSSSLGRYESRNPVRNPTQGNKTYFKLFVGKAQHSKPVLRRQRACGILPILNPCSVLRSHNGSAQATVVRCRLHSKQHSCDAASAEVQLLSWLQMPRQGRLTHVTKGKGLCLFNSALRWFCKCPTTSNT